MSRTSVRFKVVDENEGYVESFGEWLATRLSCNINQVGDTWTIISTQSVDSPATIEIQGGGQPYTVEVLRKSFSDEPGRGGRIDNSSGSDAGDSLPGIGVFREGQQVAAASLIGSNNWMWITPEIDEGTKVLLITSLHSLILNSWIN